MDNLSLILKKHYRIAAQSITQQQGGFSALAYQVETSGASGARYFLKVYEKHIASTAAWTAHLDDYMPVLAWLHASTALKGHVPRPILTTEGQFKAEDEKRIYVLFEFIEGLTLAERELTEKQVAALAGIIAELHCFGADIPCQNALPREDFAVPFCRKLKSFMDQKQDSCPADLKQSLAPHMNKLTRLNDLTETLAGEMKEMDHVMRLCHTDAHGWNLMQNSALILIDWEGLKLAPVEADLFMFYDKPYWNSFISAYQQVHQGFSISQKRMAFYLCRRRIEDIWEFIERLLVDPLSNEGRQMTLSHLKQDLVESEFVTDIVSEESLSESVPGTD